MKFVKCTMLCLIPLIIFSFSACKTEDRPWDIAADPLGRGDYSHALFFGLEFNRISALRGNITYNDTMLSEYDAYIFKYAHDDGRYIAYRSMQLQTDSKGDYTRKLNGDTYGITDDKFCLFDFNGYKTYEFSDAEEFNEYCTENKINLGNWFYPSSYGSIEGNQTKLTGKYSFEDLGKYRGQSILKNGVPMFSGYIENLNKYGRFIVFNLKIAKTNFDIEFMSQANKNLSPLSEKRLGLYRVDWGFTFPVHYDKYIVLDSLTDAVNEFDTEDEALDYVAENYAA
ncbi:MAG: hypothetical protein IJE63_07755 [Clostridia bacterium]|nr:hypothetical protein [Clostridia bacterium]